MLALPDPPAETVRLAEALIFAADRPVPTERLAAMLPAGVLPQAVLAAVAARHDGGAFELAEVAGGWCFRTAPDLAPALTRIVPQPRRLTRAAMETLAIIAWHQPVTRTEIETLRGAALGQAVLDQLLELGLVAPAGRREVPGRPALWATTSRFLEQFGLRSLAELPRREEFVGELPLASAAPAPD
jgi:segregation and condensation protein B